MQLNGILKRILLSIELLINKASNRMFWLKNSRPNNFFFNGFAADFKVCSHFNKLLV